MQIGTVAQTTEKQGVILGIANLHLEYVDKETGKTLADEETYSLPEDVVKAGKVAIKYFADKTGDFVLDLYKEKVPAEIEEDVKKFCDRVELKITFSI